MITGVNHITLVCQDLDRSRHFYEEMLGFQVTYRGAHNLYLKSGSLWLCLEENRSLEASDIPTKHHSHIALSVDQSRFDSLASSLMASDVRLWKENKSEGDSLYILDPDGHKLELHIGDLNSRLLHYAKVKQQSEFDNLSQDRPALFYLTGLPGVGKKTVASFLERLSDDLKLVDNHLINNPLLQLLDGVSKKNLPAQFWNAQDQIWEAVLSIMVDLAPQHLSYVLTNALFEGDKEDLDWFHRIADVAAKRDAIFIPVFLTLDEDLHRERIQLVDRKINHKLTNPAALDHFKRNGGPLRPRHENALTLDMGAHAPEEAALKIWRHACGL